MSVDLIPAHSPGNTDPARTAFPIVPSDSQELAILPRAVYVGTGGNLTVRLIDDSQDVVLRNLSSGQILDLRARYVRATGTTAADLVGLS
jgi:hypothetical protein